MKMLFPYDPLIKRKKGTEDHKGKIKHFRIKINDSFPRMGVCLTGNEIVPAS